MARVSHTAPTPICTRSVQSKQPLSRQYRARCSNWWHSRAIVDSTHHLDLLPDFVHELRTPRAQSRHCRRARQCERRRRIHREDLTRRYRDAGAKLLVNALGRSNVSGFSGEVPSVSEGLVRCKPLLGGSARHLALGLRDGDENRRTPPVCSDNKPRNVADDLKRDAGVAARTKVRIVRGACTVATVQHLTLEVIHGRQLEPAAQA